MALNNAAMVVAANALTSALAYGQLHYGAAGSSGTDNVTTAAREAISWASPSGAGTLVLASSISFTGGPDSGSVFSLTLWSASSGGTFYGEIPLSGDAAFNSSGGYTVTALDLTGTAT